MLVDYDVQQMCARCASPTKPVATAAQRRRAKELLFGGFDAVLEHVIESDATIQQLRGPKVKVAGRSAGGLARAASMTPEQRSEIARKAARMRWGKK